MPQADLTGSQTRVPAHTKFVVRHIAGHGYVVIDPEGNRVGEATPFRLQAAQARDAAQRAWDTRHKRGPRPCLCCRRIFDSSGIGNRMCGRCRTMDSDPLSPQRPHIPARRAS